MNITFLMSRYEWRPSGGYRVVCEYANQLVSRGHQVTIVHPRHLLCPAPPEKLHGHRRVRKMVEACRELAFKPSVDWQPIDKRVRLLYVPNSEPRYIPDGDILFATAWGTVQSVLECPTTKGEKCYLIQGYETWQGPKNLVDETWRAPLRKIVISKWLLELGGSLGSKGLVYIPNAISHERYRLVRPIRQRGRQVSMLYASAQIKGGSDGLEALSIAKTKYPDLKAVFFGLNLLRPRIPKWIDYYRNPPQDFLIRSIYNESSIYLAPSLSEGSPLPPAEAACCGCALVGTDIGGFREYIEHGVTGLLSPPSDPKALAENLCLLLQDGELRIRLATAANTYLNRFTWDHSADMLEAFLTGVVRNVSMDQDPVECSN